MVYQRFLMLTAFFRIWPTLNAYISLPEAYENAGGSRVHRRTQGVPCLGENSCDYEKASSPIQHTQAA